MITNCTNYQQKLITNLNVFIIMKFFLSYTSKVMQIQKCTYIHVPVHAMKNDSKVIKKKTYDNMAKNYK